MSLQNYKDQLAKCLYGITKAAALEQHVCIQCKTTPLFISFEGVKEYEISGLCEACFDSNCADSNDTCAASKETGEELTCQEPDTMTAENYASFGECLPERFSFTAKPVDCTNDSPDMPMMREDNGWDTAYDFDNIKSDRAFADAKILGYTVVLPEPNQLQIDIDNEQARTVYSKNIDRFQAHIASLAGQAQEAPSKSGKPGKSHITLTLNLDRINPEDRILYQLMLGSDPVREFLSYIRWINGDSAPTLFYEKKETLQLPAKPEQHMLETDTSSGTAIFGLE
jgi:hypothetical protein